MKRSAFWIPAAMVLMVASSFMSSTSLSVASDGVDTTYGRYSKPEPKVAPEYRPSGTVVNPTLPPEAVIVPQNQGIKPKPKDPGAKPQNYSQQSNQQYKQKKYEGYKPEKEEKKYWEHKTPSYSSHDYYSRPHDYNDRRYRRPPASAFSFYIGAVPYYYHSGSYYRQYNNDYVIVRAPVGARIRVLPDNCSTLYTRGHSYYVCDDDYYERVNDDYIVIERPNWVDREPDAVVGEEVRVRVDLLNVRSGPGKRYEIINQLYLGDIVQVLGVKPDWYYVNLPDGTRGWVMAENVKPHRGRQKGNG